MRKRLGKITNIIEWEAVFWVTGISLLAFSNPYSETHYAFVFPSILFDIQSPGYNLGHSISHFFHGNIMSSLKTHPLGIITIFILLGRSFTLIKRSLINSKTKGNNNG
tara:strand:- start:394 stop:717 length:324 start_codon:yes stop_codon:yes gene_type:complete